MCFETPFENGSLVFSLGAWKLHFNFSESIPIYITSAWFSVTVIVQKKPYLLYCIANLTDAGRCILRNIKFAQVKQIDPRNN